MNHTHEQHARLAAAIHALPAGVWETWTSHSFRRITAVIDHRHGPDGGVLHGTKQSDGHPDLSMDERQLRALCDLRNTVAEIVGAI